MKTVKKGKKIVRASDDAAQEMIKTKGWKYCPKSEWRESATTELVNGVWQVRDAKPVESKKKLKKKLKKKFIKVDDAGVNLKTGKFNG